MLRCMAVMADQIPSFWWSQAYTEMSITVSQKLQIWSITWKCSA